MSNAPKTRKRPNVLDVFLAGLGATALVYIALGSYLGWPGSSEDRIFFSVLSGVFGTGIGLAAVMAAGLLKEAHAERGNAAAARVVPAPMNEEDVAKLTRSFTAKSTEELKVIYAKRDTDEYRAEAIEAIRRILVARDELKS